jgi:hypothetical protein
MAKRDRVRLGLAYGTLPGHPERGEESFVIELLDDGQVRVHIVAFCALVHAACRPDFPARPGRHDGALHPRSTPVALATSLVFA